jgi:hypothetical protein
MLKDIIELNTGPYNQFTSNNKIKLNIDTEQLLLI